MKKYFFLMLAGLIVVSAISSQAGATNLPVANYSFEANTPGDGGWFTDYLGSQFVRTIHGWNYVPGPPYVGTQRFLAANYPAGVPDGLNAAYVNAGAAISQVVQGTALTGGHLYTLSVFAGERLDSYSPNQTYELQLLAGGTVLAEMQDKVDQPGSFELASLQYLPKAGDHFGSPLQIKLLSFGGQTSFDKVSLTNCVPTPIPGGVTLMLSGLMGMSALGLRLRKN